MLKIQRKQKIQPLIRYDINLKFYQYYIKIYDFCGSDTLEITCKAITKWLYKRLESAVLVCYRTTMSI